MRGVIVSTSFAERDWVLLIASLRGMRKVLIVDKWTWGGTGYLVIEVQRGGR